MVNSQTNICYMPTWSDTKIFQTLVQRQGHYAKAMINLLGRPPVMGKIELLLDKGGTTPKDFTLHDSGHSFRVAERMWELIPQSTKEILSDYELGILLLSAYLHDIGMSPKYEKIYRHQTFLTEKKTDLSEQEIKEFQQWIDDDTRTGDLDIRSELVSESELSKYILSYYVRHKHNEWGAEWIESNLSGEILDYYLTWQEDLILVCKSHHFGLDHLLQECFDPRPVMPDLVVHLRYLAMCLRVADVIENDPERTPEVLLDHRQIDGASLSYWLKDQLYRLLKHDRTYIVYARPTKAFLHKAIEDTATQIEAELRLCEELIRRKPLTQSYSISLSGYKWDVNPFVKRDIRPEGNAYEYIDGAFRPNTAKLLEILGGHQLYGESIWAYRELIQNAFDAVREQLAWQIINKDLDPKENLPKLKELVAIDLSLVEKEGELWLICRDQGVGMTKGIIEHFFLHSGSTKRHEIKALERECQKRGFSLGRTGQFGIGVLSYFMLADKVVIRTQRELNTGYHSAESVGWQFEINGTHDFGELTRCNTQFGGTELQLRLKEKVAQKINEWDSKFCSFLKNEIIKVPCVLHYRSFLGKELTINPGWTMNELEIQNEILAIAKKDLFESVRSESEMGIVSSHKREMRKTESALREDYIAGIEEKLAFFSRKGEIGDFLKYRIHIPYFKLVDGNSFYFLNERLKDAQYFLKDSGETLIWHPRDQVKYALRGMKVEISERFDFYRLPPLYLELDLEDVDTAGLSVSRRNLQLSEDVLSDIEKRIERECLSLVQFHNASFENKYALLNYYFGGLFPGQFFWIFANSPSDERMVLNEITYPALIIPDRLFKNWGPTDLDGKRLCLLQGISSSGREPFFPYLDFKLKCTIGLLEEEPYAPLMVIVGQPHGCARPCIHEVELPDQWMKLFVIKSGTDDALVALNNNHFLYSLYDDEIIKHCLSDVFEKEFKEGNILVNPEKESECFGFFVFVACKCDEEKWLAQCEMNSNLIKEIFLQLGITELLVMDSEKLSVISYGLFNYYWTDRDKEEILPRIEDEKYILVVGD